MYWLHLPLLELTTPLLHLWLFVYRCWLFELGALVRPLFSFATVRTRMLQIHQETPFHSTRLRSAPLSASTSFEKSVPTSRKPTI